MKNIYSAVLSLILSFAAISQVLEVHQSNFIPVSVNGNSLEFAWAGGLSAAEFSTMDLNDDGIEDLVVFELAGEKVVPFLRHQNGGVAEYTFAPEYINQFPKIHGWMLLRDFNLDGKKDIFCAAIGGIYVYENTSNTSNLQWEIRDTLLMSEYEFDQNPFFSNIYVSSIDLPAIADHDGDGDLDIHTFSLGSSTIEYHRNMSMEYYGVPDSLNFKLVNRCYANIAEDPISPEIFLSDEAESYCSFNVLNPEFGSEGDSRSGAHSGSTITSFDFDNNGYKDLLIGDISNTGMVLAKIGNSESGRDSAFAVLTEFPPVDFVNLKIYLAAYYEDIDLDGISDLVISPQTELSSADAVSVWYYKNTGAETSPNFILEKEDFLQDEMIELGTGCFPHLIDYNVDGLMDLVVSNRGFFQTDGSYNGYVYLFENVGTLNSPAFELVSTDFSSLSTIGLGEGMFPTFGDLDNDGDVDMIVAIATGGMHYFENTAGPGNEVNYILVQANFEDFLGNPIDPGSWSSPQLFDLDNDSDLDLIIGERNGNLNFYKNIGSPELASFALENDTLGFISADVNGDFLGYSVPYFFYNDGELQLLVGNYQGEIYWINDITNNLNGHFVILDSVFADIDVGERAAPVIYDLNNDGNPEILVGNLAGGLDLFKGGLANTIPEFQDESSFIQITPNPSRGLINISFDDSSNESIFLRLFANNGALIFEKSIREKTQIDISNLNDGIYLMYAAKGRQYQSTKIIIVH